MGYSMKLGVMMENFTVPENGSVSWQWAGKWYTMAYADSRRLDSLYNGGHPHGPTHEEKIAIVANGILANPVPELSIVAVREPVRLPRTIQPRIVGAFFRPWIMGW